MLNHTQDAEDVLQFLSQYQRYYILSHIEPDGDCVAASLALASFLKRRGKLVTLLNEGPFDRPEIRNYQPHFESTAPAATALQDSDAAAVILDCSDYGRLGALSQIVGQLPVAVIDHHSTNETNAACTLLDSSAPSTTVLIQLLIEHSGERLTPTEARHALFGLCTDTAYFRHLDHDSGDAFRFAARLVDAGASPRETHDAMFGGQSLASRYLIARWLERARPLCEGRALITYHTREDGREFAPAEFDTATLYQLLLGVHGCSVVAFVREESETSCTGSLRSITDLDVAAIARMFGGGGHKRAAGFFIERSYTEVYAQLTTVIEERLAELPPPVPNVHPETP